MIQEIITYIILLVTIIITVVRLYRFFAKKTPGACNSCYQAESGCKIAGLKKNLKNKHAHISFE